jgi:hypothetical protein
MITYSFFPVCEPGAALFGTHFQVKKNTLKRQKKENKVN